MQQEITNLTSYPYKAVAHISVQFKDGYSARGTGAVVGRNDVLTATHVIYSPDHGGWASKVTIYPGADYNSKTGTLSQPYGSYSYATLSAWPSQTFAVPSNTTMESSEVPYDVALISTWEPIGDAVGWFGLSTDYNTSQWAYQIGYPAGSTGMMFGTAWIRHDPIYQEYHAYASDGSDIMGPGSSGGPLYVMNNGNPYIIGVKSAGSSTTSQWADIGYTYDRIIEVINSNDYYMTAADDAFVINAVKYGPAPGLGGVRKVGTINADILYGTQNNDVFIPSKGNDSISAGNGIDTVLFSDKASAYQISKQGSSLIVSHRTWLGNDDVDVLDGIERLIFTDQAVAFDSSGNAGKAYRIYQAAFDRTPDAAGLGYWMSRMDSGLSLEQVAQGFLGSTEFRVLYGSNPSTSTFVSKLYFNVLHRTPETSGYNYWNSLINTGKINKAQALAEFSESTENQIQVAGAIQQGMVYDLYE